MQRQLEEDRQTSTHQLLKVHQVVMKSLVALMDKGDICRRRFKKRELRFYFGYARNE